MLNKEININFKNKYEETPLLYAIKTNASNEIIKYLINSGADINVTTNEINIDFYSYKKGIDNKTPFIWAILNNNLEIAKILLKKGADINFSPRNGTTALIEASKNCDDIEIIKFLITNGANVNAKTKNVLDYRNEKLINELNLKYNLKKGEIYTEPISLIPYSDKTALINAVSRRQPKKDIIELLIENGADVNARTSKGSSGLGAAITYHYEDIAILLINNGADGNLLGIFDDMYNVAELLIKKGADINGKTYDGIMPPLIYAVDYGQIKITELLLKNRADVNIKFENKGVIYYLKLKDFAYYNYPEKRKNYKKILKLLKKYGAKE